MSEKKLRRKHRVCVKLNEKELKVLNKYFDKYKIKNRSKAIREMIMHHIINKMVEQDYPKLFAENDEHISEETENFIDNQAVTKLSTPKLFE